jgi:hypothetical protein
MYRFCRGVVWKYNACQTRGIDLFDTCLFDTCLFDTCLS